MLDWTSETSETREEESVLGFTIRLSNIRDVLILDVNLHFKDSTSGNLSVLLLLIEREI